MEMTEKQKDIKIAYLEQENSKLRSQLTDLMIVTGLIHDGKEEAPSEGKDETTVTGEGVQQ